MMSGNTFFAVFLIFHFITFGKIHLLGSDTITYYQHIKPIIDEHCTGCHRTGQTAPFSLESYEDVKKRASMVEMVVESKYMPPWHADTLFRTFHNQRALSASSLNKILAWIKSGAPAGLPQKKGGVNGFNWPSPDKIVAFQKPFIIPGDNEEQYRFFVIPVDNPAPIYLRGVGFVPKNKTLAHHSRIMIDTTKRIRPFDAASVWQAGPQLEKMNIPLANSFWTGWVPGNFPLFYPDGVAKVLPANADLVVNMHYAPSAKEETDQSEIHLYYAKGKPRRIIETLVFDETWVTNKPFEFQPDTVITFYMRSPVLPVDLSLLSVLPHMHLLGKSFKSFAITPDGDMIPLIHIPEWDFNWQQTYQFNNLLKIPRGSVIYAEATFDNTKNNPKNPYFPPAKVRYGWGTKDEMMNLIFEYLLYEPGDEYLDFYASEH